MNPFMIQLRRKEKWMALSLGVMGIVYLLGLFGAVLICTLAGEKTSAAFGAVFALIAACFIHLFGNMFGFLQGFNLAVSMGQTRRKFVWCYEAVTILELTVLAVLAWLMYLIEKAVYHVLLPQVSLHVSMETVFHWRVLGPVMFALMLIEILVPALILRYGPKVVWVVWAVWMIICLSPNWFAHNEKLALGVQRMFAPVMSAAGHLGAGFWVGSGLILGAVLLGASWNMLRKQRVTV